MTATSSVRDEEFLQGLINAGNAQRVIGPELAFISKHSKIADRLYNEETDIRGTVRSAYERAEFSVLQLLMRFRDEFDRSAKGLTVN